MEGPSAIISPLATLSPVETMGRWLRQVPWLERSNFFKGYSRTLPLSSRILIMLEQQPTTTPASFAMTMTPESFAIAASMPVATMEDSVFKSGTA